MSGHHRPGGAGRARARPAAREAARRSSKRSPGNFRAHHALIVSHILAHLDYLDETIATLTEEIEQRLAPFAHKAELLRTITGVAARNAR